MSYTSWYVEWTGPSMLPDTDISGIQDSPALSPMIHNVQSDEGAGYATSDLFIKHPTKDLWKMQVLVVC